MRLASFPSLDGRSRGYLADKQRLPLNWHGPKNCCSASDWLQLIAILRRRFEKPDFPVHSFPELSLDAWTYNGATAGSNDDGRLCCSAQCRGVASPASAQRGSWRSLLSGAA